MNWSNKSWDKEDAEYGQKRKVGNRGSQHRPHVIGSFYSSKMNRVVEYESLNEYLFYSLLELDVQTVRYYVQPIEVEIPCLSKNGKPKCWPHIPDALVFRQWHEPYLFQVKDSSTQQSANQERINEYCTQFALKKGWTYRVVRPKTIPLAMARNAKFLMGFLQPRTDFELLIPEIVSRLMFLQTATIDKLSKGFQGKAHPLQVLPAIYHLIANGTFVTDVNEEITVLSEVRIASGQNFAGFFLPGE